MMPYDLAVRQAEVGIIMPPEIVLENAMVAAKALKRVVSSKPKPVILNGEQYLEFEDLQLLGQFYSYTVKTGDAVPVEIDGVKGAKAHADLIDLKTGIYLGGAEAYCMRDEEHWNTRPKYEWQGEGDNRKRVKVGDEVVPWFQLASMAQTRAGAKAFRNRLAWVVVLAGYRPTPAEEMTEDTVSAAVKERRTVDKSAHWCEVHGTSFFKKGRMPRFAHPLPGGGWCNEGDVDQGKTKAQLEKDKDELFGEPLTAQATQAAVVKAEAKPAPEPSLKTSPATLSDQTEAVKPESNGITSEKAVERGKQKPKRDITTLKTIEQLARALKEDFGLSYQEQWNELNIRNWNDLAISPAEAYAQVEAVRKKSAS